MNIRVFQTASAMALICCFFSAGSAVAQEAGAEPEGVGEIVVTAQKRSENVQNIPIAINALGGDALQDRRITGA